MSKKMACIPNDEEKEVNQDEKNTSCGFGSFTPNYLQKFANPFVYLIIFCLAGFIQNAYSTYLIGISSTLERRFSYDTKVTGALLLADNVSPLLFSIFLGYYGKNSHRPRFLFFGMMCIVLSCFIAYFPYLLFGSEINMSSVSQKKNVDLCLASHISQNCDELRWQTVVAVCILFIANFLKGIGSSIFYTIGFPYLDDNVKKKKSPAYLGATYFMRIFAPYCGFQLSSFCLKYYENPFIDPDFGKNDSRWIGAWWMGFIILVILLLFISLPFLLFPRYMPKQVNRRKFENRKTSLCDLWLSLKGLAGNPVLMLHTLSKIFQINGFFAFFTFMPRYMESQFHDSASDASFYTGIVQLSASAPVLLLSGFCIYMFQPKARILTGYMFFVQVLSGLVMISALNMYCEPNQSVKNDSFLYHKNEVCNSHCSCDGTNFSPICDIYGSSHFSACSAGCLKTETFQKTVTFANCSCIPMDNSTSYIFQATKGVCSESCNKFLPYIISIVVSNIFAASARVGSFLITLRCVDEEDKSLTLGAVEFLISLFATIPNSFMYGYFIDKSCLRWEETCKQQGNCLFYDTNLLRYYLHGIPIFFISLAAVCDILVFLRSSKLRNIYDEREQNKDPKVELVEKDHADHN